MSLGTHISRHRFISLLLLPCLIAQASGECYWPDGGVMQTGSPCPFGDGCCSTGETCLKNGLCFNYWGDIYRGGCTDKNYGPTCPQACKDYMYAYVSSDPSEKDDYYMNLEPCEMLGSTTWCCAIDRNDTTSCCGNATLTVPTGLFNPDLFIPQATPTSGSSTSSPTASSTAGSIIATATVYRDALSSATGTGEHKSSSTAAVGLGVGIPLGIVAVAGWVTVWVLVRRAAGNRILMGTQNPGYGQWGMYAGNGGASSAGQSMVQAANMPQELGGMQYSEADPGANTIYKPGGIGHGTPF